MIHRFGLRIIIILLLVFYSENLDAQTSSLSGYVMDADSEETLLGATVLIIGKDNEGVEFKKGVHTNKKGFFSIKNIPVGIHSIRVSSLGFDKLKISITFDGSAIRKDLKLNPLSYRTKSVNVIAEREAEKREISISKVDIPIQQIKNIRIGGESDVMRTLQLLPGVLTSSQISSGLYVRGGTPDQNLVLMDGAAVYNPSHLFGFISSFNTEALKDVELIKGAYPAEYGGRLSSVLNIVQKDGNKKEYKGQFGIGILSSKAFVEGPTFDDGSFFLAGRYTNIGLLLKFADVDPENPLPDYGFYDLNFKLNQGFGDNDRVTVGAFLSGDEMIYSANGFDATIGIGNQLLSADWTHLFSKDLFSRLNITGSKYINNLEFDNSGFVVSIENSIQDITAKMSIEWFATDDITTKAGIEYNNYTFNYFQNFTGESAPAADDQLDLNIVDNNFATYIQSNIVVEELLSFQFGLRAAYFNYSDIGVLEPRISMRYQMLENFIVKFGYGIYNQNLKLATQPDFSFFDTWLGTDNTLNLGKSIHYVLSFETTAFEDYAFNVDFYYKSLDNINELRRNSFGGTNAKDVLFEGDGSAYGGELFLKKKYGDFTGWIGYGYGFVDAQFDSINYGNKFNPKYDRRNDFKMVGQWAINKSWEIGGAFKFQSGQPYTGVSSKIAFTLEGDNRSRGKTFGLDRYSLRLPPSHQLDLYASYLFEIFKPFDSRVTLDIYNVYNRRDVWFRYYDAINEPNEYVDVLLLPIIPTVSFEINL